MTQPRSRARFPGESPEYRSAREELLRAELKLREQLAAVAELRRKLPLGGRVKQDYEFSEIGATGEGAQHTRLSELFAPGKDSLIVYSFMYGPQAEQPCPACNSFLDGLDGYAPHITNKVNLAVVAKSPIERLQAWSKGRGWQNLRLLSSERNTYNSDYHAETPAGDQMPACNVFTKTSEGIFHFYATELLYAPVEGHPRHVDLLWPIWNFFDLTPEGRGDWFPKLSY